MKEERFLILFNFCPLSEDFCEIPVKEREKWLEWTYTIIRIMYNMYNIYV